MSQPLHSGHTTIHHLLKQFFPLHNPFPTGNQSESHRELHPGPILNSNIYENFIKINFFSNKSNFDQATQKRFKKAMLYGKINLNHAKINSTILISQRNVPNHNYENDHKNPDPYYQKGNIRSS